jgi:putative ABC transport system substrate-binding protein
VRPRTFVTALGGVALLPLAGRAQQPARMRRVGVLLTLSESEPSTQAMVTTIAQELARFGWVEGKNIRMDYRFCRGRSSSP